MRLRTLAATFTAAVAVLAPTAASAATSDHADPAGDVTRFTYNNSTEKEVRTVDPTITEGDAVRTVIKHNPRKVITTTYFRELTPPGNDGAKAFFVGYRTNEHIRRDVTISVGSGTTRGHHVLTNRRDNRVRCAGLRHKIDYAANTITISTPRKCLSRPRWIQALALSSRVTDITKNVSSTYIEDALRRGFTDERPAWSPRLRRG